MQRILHVRSARATMLLAAGLVALSTIMSAFTLAPVSAAQVTTRSINIGTGEAGATTDYVITFTVPASTYGSFRVSFCDNNPLPGQNCVFDGAGDDIPNLSGATVTSAVLGSATGCTTIGDTIGTNYIDFDCNATEAVSRTFTATVTGVVNPANTTDGNNNNTFYARIYTFAGIAPTAYSATPEPAGNNDGGVAMSTANALNLTARVQEVLQFCVGDTNTAAAPSDDCTDVSGTTVDLGVLDSNNINKSSTATGVAANDTNGYVMVRTNALTGVNIDYYGGDASGRMTSGANFIGPQASEAVLTTGVAAWGMEVDNADGGSPDAGIDMTASASGTASLSLDSNFNADNQAYWGATATVADDLANSSGPVDDEAMTLDFHGAAAILTPTGVYTTTITFVATGTF